MASNIFANYSAGCINVVMKLTSLRKIMKDICVPGELKLIQQ